MNKRGVWLALAMGVALAGCGKSEAVNMPKDRISTENSTEGVVTLEAETEKETKADTEQKRAEADGMIPSYLTGEMTAVEIADRRPVAIMISNDKEAQPHYGINHAGIIYEAPVEGVMNRYMAVIEDYDNLDRIGSVRSCRTYYTYFAREFEAVCAHFGQSVFALPYLENMDHLNGIEGKGAVAFYRSKDRKSPHNAYAGSEGIKKGIEALGYENAYPSGYNGHYHFVKPEYPVLLEDGMDAATVKPGYVYNEPWFEFHKDDGLYYRFQYGGPEMGDEGQLAVKNIIFQYCPTGFYRPSEYLDIDVHSPGSGYYFTNGRGAVVTWKKDGEYGVTRYYDNGGREIMLNPGKTWVCIIASDRVDKAEFYGEQTD